MHDDLGFGFRLHYFRDLANAGASDLRLLAMDETVPFEVQAFCPACEVELKILATLITGGDLSRVRLGVCVECGYTGYMDRPTRQWIADFYRENWDRGRIRDVRVEAALAGDTLTAVKQNAIHLARRIWVPQEKLVCDIGCGKGEVLKEFERLGFRNLIGVENSLYRARLTKMRYGYPVLTGDFEGEAVGRELRRRAPVGLFFSFHTLEHVYHPREVITAMAELQGVGDYAILVMPNALHEPGVINLFWLPHLHAYTSVTLERLLNHSGYEVVDDIRDYERHLVVAARKVSGVPKLRYTPSGNYLPYHLERLQKWFFMNSLESSKRYRMCWVRKAYVPWIERAPSSKFLDLSIRSFARIWQYAAARLLGRFDNTRSMVISRLEKRLIARADSPLEIQYEGDIELLLR